MKNYSLKTRGEERGRGRVRLSRPLPLRRREPPRKEGMIIAGYKLKRSVKLGVNAIPVVQVDLPPVTLDSSLARPPLLLASAEDKD